MNLKERRIAMALDNGDVHYIPGAYTPSRASAKELADRYIREWDERRIKAKKPLPKKAPAICFSRKIGVGALEIADILSEKIGYRVVDREILEHIAGQADLSEKTVELFDERYRGKLNEFLALAFGEKSFIESDYSRNLFGAVYAISGLDPTIFVGRGVHLLLPMEETLSVRFICAREKRGQRVAKILKVSEKEAYRKLDQRDKEQRDFFKKVYGKRDASPYEFDLVINCDRIPHPQGAAEIVASALKEKFGDQRPK
jgi:cytidylate kinase